MLMILRDERKRAIFDQVLFLVIVSAFIYYLSANLIENLNRLGISTGFSFLWQEAGYQIGGALIDFDDTDSYALAHIVGLLNTLLATFLIIVSASILGFIIGILRMSPNPLMTNTIRYVIEVIRNIPSLVHIVIWFSLALHLPPVRQSFDIYNTVFISNRGIYLPDPNFESGMWGVLFLFICLLAYAFFRKRKAQQLMRETGKYQATFLSNTLIIWGGTICAYLLFGLPITWQAPTLSGFDFDGGITIAPELFAIWIALSIYFSSHVAELVRGGVQSVSKGQFEAASALGVRYSITMKMVVIPQAMRVIVPPLTNVYQNILKTTSLGVAIGYAEMTATTGGTTLNLTGQAIECILLMMVSYGIISLIIAAIMDQINKHVAIVER